MVERHPVTGMRYVVVIPDGFGAYTDYRFAYHTLDLPWLTTISSDEYHLRRDALLADPDAFVVLWSVEEAPRPRRAHVAALYMEAVGKPGVIPINHVQHWHRFKTLSEGYDAVLAHTPAMCDRMRADFGLPAYLYPAGWSPSWGEIPTPFAARNNRLVYWGGPIGRRLEIIPWLRRQLATLTDVSGKYGYDLRAELVEARAALYVAFAHVESFSTWRLWQVLSAGVPLIAERGDAWPFVEGKHYLGIDTFPDAAHERGDVLGQLRAHLDSPEPEFVAMRAHAAFAERFTVERCVTDYLVPASTAIRGSR